MHTQGRIRRWDADKGFGFIQGARSSNVFFHIRDYRGSTPPVEGMRVAYEEIQVGGKGPRAMDVRPQGATAAAPPFASAPAPRPIRSERPAAPARQRPRAAARERNDGAAGASLAMALMLGWLALLAWGAWAQRLPVWLLGAMAALNLVTFLSYALDKSAAQRGGWRTSEKQLHLLALLGGWPAAWWAQQWLRHKSRKQEFRTVYWATVLLHCAGLATLVLRPDLLPI
jgi:uncharacterized membrane protein YsdA (DUF1294 family)/cold shock CspA family protein